MAGKEEDNKPRSIHVKATKKIKIGKKNNNVCSNIKQEPRHTLLKRTRNLGHVKLSFCFFFVCNIICKIYLFTCEPSLCLNIHAALLFQSCTALRSCFFLLWFKQRTSWTNDPIAFAVHTTTHFMIQSRLCVDHRVFHQHCNCHWTHTTRYWSNGARSFKGGFVINITCKQEQGTKRKKRPFNKVTKTSTHSTV